MAYRTIVTAVTEFEAERGTLDAAIALARRQSAHLDVLCLGLDRTEPGIYYAGASAVLVQDNLARAQADAEAQEKAVTERLGPEDIAWTARRAAVPVLGLDAYIGQRVRFADLAVLPKPYAEGRGREAEAIVEAALFAGAVPVLVIPRECPDLPEGGRVAVAWNDSREALVAIRAALPLLREAGEVQLAIVDPPAHGPDRSDPGGELAEVLSRHGVRCDVAVLARTMPRVSDILCRHARDTGAGLIVMGAYGHSRFREAILGGATRNMLEIAEVPVLMAH